MNWKKSHGVSVNEFKWKLKLWARDLIESIKEYEPISGQNSKEAVGNRTPDKNQELENLLGVRLTLWMLIDRLTKEVGRRRKCVK